MTIVVVSQHVERAQNYSPPTSFSVNKLFPMFVFHAWSLAHPHAKVVQSWKGVASAMHTATVQSAAENATLTAETKALKSRKRELEAQAHDLQCIVVAAVAERDQLALKHKVLKSRKRELEAQVHDLQCIMVAAVAQRDQLALNLQKVGGGTPGQTIGSSTTTNDKENFDGSTNDDENGRGGDCTKD